MISSVADSVLVKRTLDGDQRAFGELIDRYQKPVFSHALKTLGDKQDAEDVTQTVFLKAFEHLGKYKPEYKFFSWIYRIAINESINHAKRRKPVESFDESTALPADIFADHDLEREVLDGIMRLGIEDRAIVLLKHFEGFSYSDIEYIMEIPIKTVKSRLYSARQRLREILIRERRAIDD
jgi:RNA polymerase sigma-70 factor (ECF subfamily)